MKALTLLLALVCTPVFAAPITVPHNITVKSDYNKVVAVCRQNRYKIMESSGLRVLEQLANDQYRVRVDDLEFIVAEDRTVQNGVLTVRWRLTQTRSRMKSYDSTIEYRQLNTGTSISGSMTADVGGTKFGAMVLQNNVKRGIERMQKTLLNLLGE